MEKAIDVIEKFLEWCVKAYCFVDSHETAVVFTLCIAVLFLFIGRRRR